MDFLNFTFHFISQGLDSSMSPRPRDILSNGASPTAAQARGRSPSSSASVTSRESTVTPGDNFALSMCAFFA